MCVSEIRLKRICVNQGLGVRDLNCQLDHVTNISGEKMAGPG